MCHTYTMKTTELNLMTLAQQYSDEGAARGLLESILWPNGPVCGIKFEDAIKALLQTPVPQKPKKKK